MTISHLIESTIKSVPPFYMGEPNLVLTYKIDTNEFVTDSVGNLSAKKREIIIKASVKDDRNSITEIMAGAGLYQMYLIGRVVEVINGNLPPSKLLPNEINLELMAKGVLKDRATNSTKTGDFKLLPVPQHRFENFSKHMGSKILGILYLKGAV